MALDIAKYEKLQNLNDFVDDRYIDVTVRGLLVFGMNIFMQSTLYREFDRIKELSIIIESKKFTNQQRSEFVNYAHTYLLDCISILMFFENYLKCVLIKKKYLVHEINRTNPKLETLQKAQRKRPITHDELDRIEPFIQLLPGKQIRNLGLMKNTISISTILQSKNYLALLDDDIPIQYIKEMNDYRNKVHLYMSASYDTIIFHQFEEIRKSIINICAKNNIIVGKGFINE